MHYLKNDRNRQLELECRGKFVGPMPPANFLKEFLGDKQLKHGINESFKFTRKSKIHLTKAQKKKGEVEMYSHLIKGIQECCPQLKIRDTHNTAHESEWARKGTKIKPDITAYDEDASLARPMDLTKAEIIVEVKVNPRDDAFADSPSGETTAHENPTIQGGDTRGQITTYAAAQLAAQYRTHVFSVLIIKDKARLIRWDRAGAIFTSLFDYCKTDYLMKFFWRYNYATRGARGHDESVTIPHDLDDELVSEARKVLGCSPNDPLYRFEVVDETPGEGLGKINYYLGGAPIFKGTEPLTGCSTRGIVVYDIQNRKVAYLKDTWRVCGTEYEIDKEGETYRKLYAARVRNVPTVLAHGDMVPQLRGHRHYRLVLKEVGRDLTSFETVGKFVTLWQMLNKVPKVLDIYQNFF
ncbi:hypothetical protein MPER_09392 [Moniliophthora perniciosa FA553]|nr:hypothetical protein MPER_09392 [Moniliophthora perniciosa FA553]